MEPVSLWAIVDLSDNTVLEIFTTFEAARSEYEFIVSTVDRVPSVVDILYRDGHMESVSVVRSSDLGILFFRSLGVCPVNDKAAKLMEVTK